MMDSIRRLLLAFLLALPLVAQAQTPAAVQAFRPFEDMASQIAYITNIKELGHASQFLTSEKANIETALAWSGQAGYLIEVRVQTNPMTMHERLIGHPILLGTGADPVDAYARAYADDMLYNPSATSGNVYSPEKSFFFWSELRKPWWPYGKPVLKSGVIPPEASEVAREEALARIADRYVIDEMTQLAARRALTTTIARLSQEAKNRELAAELTALAARAEKQRAMREDISRKLERELDRSDRASRVLGTLDKLGAVLGVASAWAQACAALDDLPSTPPVGVESSANVADSIKQYQSSKMVVIEDLRARRDSTEIEFRQSAEAIRVQLRDANVPDVARWQIGPLLH